MTPMCVFNNVWYFSSDSANDGLVQPVIRPFCANDGFVPRAIRPFCANSGAILGYESLEDFFMCVFKNVWYFSSESANDGLVQPVIRTFCANDGCVQRAIRQFCETHCPIIKHQYKSMQTSTNFMVKSCKTTPKTYQTQFKIINT